MDDLLPYYNRELLYLRQMGQEFADRHPRIASQLRLSGDAIDDPHVSRLIQGVAFLNARVERRLDDEFPELVDTLLEILYPHYLSSIPSMATVQFRPKPDVTVPQVIPANTELDSEPVQGEVCRFRTRYPVTLWPIVISEAVLKGRPIVAPPNPRAMGAHSTLRLSLRCSAPDLTFSELQPESLRVFLRGQPSQVYGIHELIFNNTVSIAIGDSPTDPNPLILSPDAVKPVGFGPDDNILPYATQSQPAYRTLTEFFACPDKFLYFDIDLSAKVLQSAGPELHVFFYFNKSDATLERSVSKDMFALGCTPIINLFPQRAEPILASQNRLEYRVIADIRRQEALEVHSILSVSATNSDGERRPILPFYSRSPTTDGSERPAYWSLSRRPSEGRVPGSEIYLSFSDLDPTFSTADLVVSTEVLCTNRDLPAKLPYGGGHPILTPVRGIAADDVLCVSPLTPAFRMPRGNRRSWRLVSHLLLNHLSLTGEQGLETLRDILQLYDFKDSPESKRIILGMTALKVRHGTARAPRRPGDSAWGDAICRGIDLNVEFDPAYFSGSSLFLFAMVLDQFFGLYASINSFTRLTASVKGQPGKLHTWPARAGFRPLI